MSIGTGVTGAGEEFVDIAFAELSVHGPTSHTGNMMIQSFDRLTSSSSFLKALYAAHVSQQIHIEATRSKTVKRCQERKKNSVCAVPLQHNGSRPTQSQNRCQHQVSEAPEVASELYFTHQLPTCKIPIKQPALEVPIRKIDSWCQASWRMTHCVILKICLPNDVQSIHTDMHDMPTPCA